jgi:hypothetical protein
MLLEEMGHERAFWNGRGLPSDKVILDCPIAISFISSAALLLYACPKSGLSLGLLLGSPDQIRFFSLALFVSRIFGIGVLFLLRDRCNATGTRCHFPYG